MFTQLTKSREEEKLEEEKLLAKKWRNTLANIKLWIFTSVYIVKQRLYKEDNYKQLNPAGYQPPVGSSSSRTCP